jgi:cobalamin biosynthetic protein CobC
MRGEIAHGGGLAEAVSRYGGSLQDWLDLSTGINPVPVALPALKASIWARLPDRDLFDAARLAARRFYGTAPGVLPLPVPGTQSLIQRLPGLIGPDSRAAILAPTYGEYGRVLRRAGVALDQIAGLDAVTDAHRLVVVVNPNNPDGRRVFLAELLGLSERLEKRGGVLVVDEAFADADPAESLAGEAGVQRGLIVFRSFGKFFGLAGLRLGFLVADPETAARIQSELGPWAVSGPALAIAAGVMRDGEAIARLRASIAERHGAMKRVLADAGLTVRGGTALFFLVEHERAGALHDELCRRRILVRAFDYAPNWLRFGLAPDAASDARLASALAASRVRG